MVRQSFDIYFVLQLINVLSIRSLDKNAIISPSYNIQQLFLCCLLPGGGSLEKGYCSSRKRSEAPDANCGNAGRLIVAGALGLTTKMRVVSSHLRLSVLNVLGINLW